MRVQLPLVLRLCERCGSDSKNLEVTGYEADDVNRTNGPSPAGIPCFDYSLEKVANDKDHEAAFIVFPQNVHTPAHRFRRSTGATIIATKKVEEIWAFVPPDKDGGTNFASRRQRLITVPAKRPREGCRRTLKKYGIVEKAPSHG